MQESVLCLGFCTDLNQFVIGQWGCALEEKKKKKTGELAKEDWRKPTEQVWLWQEVEPKDWSNT